jgi:hypothetical protein
MCTDHSVEIFVKFHMSTKHIGQIVIAKNRNSVFREENSLLNSLPSIPISVYVQNREILAIENLVILNGHSKFYVFISESELKYILQWC